MKVIKREKLPVNIAFTQYYNTDNNDNVVQEYSDSITRSGGETDGYMISELGNNTILPWINKREHRKIGI